MFLKIGRLFQNEFAYVHVAKTYVGMAGQPQSRLFLALSLGLMPHPLYPRRNNSLCHL